MFTSDTLADKVGAVPIEKSRPLPIVNNLLPAHTIPAAAKKEPRYAANQAAEIDQSERRAPSGRTDSYLTKAGPQDISYYDLKRHWTKKIEPHLNDTELNDILTKDFNKFTWGRWRIGFGKNELPHEFETAFSFFEHRGPLARFRWYTKHGACHWLVNFTLRLAMLAIPSQTWRIITSDAHSTVWNGKKPPI
jgi:hypothetical protein